MKKKSIHENKNVYLMYSLNIYRAIIITIIILSIIITIIANIVVVTD